MSLVGAGDEHLIVCARDAVLVAGHVAEVAAVDGECAASAGNAKACRSALDDAAVDDNVAVLFIFTLDAILRTVKRTAADSQFCASTVVVKDSNGNNVFKNKDNVGTPSVLLFSVPEDLYLLLSKAIYVGMDIVAVPRNASYTTNPSDTVVKSEFLQSFILSKTISIPDDDVQSK